MAPCCRPSSRRCWPPRGCARGWRWRSSAGTFARTRSSSSRDDWANWRGRSFHRHTKKAELATPRPYDLHHSLVSLLIREQRSSIVEIANQLDHSPIETLKTYVHVMREDRRHEPIAAATLIRQARLAAAPHD